MKTFDLLVSVHCYAGDANQVRHFLPSYVQHGAPVLIMSPQDSQVTFPGKVGIRTRFFGKRAYTGQESLDRQIGQMKQLLEYPAKHYLMHDSDSLLLSSRLPGYLYNSGDVVWSNEVHDWRTHPSPYNPRLAFQPPYFMNRAVLEKLVKVASKPKTDPITPFIDWLMMALCFEAGLPHKSFPDGLSFGTGQWPEQNLMINAVRNEGKYILHSVKLPHVYDRLCSARAAYRGPLP
jgi:hypothetical protein